MQSYLTPGIHVAPPPTTDDDVRLVRTDIAGFVGYAERGPIAPSNSATLTDPTTLAYRLTSWTQFQTHFGGLTPYSLMPYAVCAFFENGGATCYVVRVGGSTSADPSSTPQAAAGCFTMPIGAIASPAATVTRISKIGATTLTLDSTSGLRPKTVIGIGVGSALQLRTVASVTNGQTLVLSGALSADVPAKTQMWIVSGEALTATANAGQSVVQIANSGMFQAGDTVAVFAAGMAETATIGAILNSSTVRLDSNLQGTYSQAYMQKLTPGLQITALTPGNWGNRLLVVLTPRLPILPSTVYNRFDLRVTLTPGPDPTLPSEAESFTNLTLDSTDPVNFAPLVVNDPVTGSNLIRITVPDTLTDFGLSNGPAGPFYVTLVGGRDGLSAVTVRDFIGGDGDFRGLRVLQEIDEIGILAAPDAVNPSQTPPPTMLPAAPNPCSAPASAATATSIPDDPTVQPPLLYAAPIMQALVAQASTLRYRVAVLDTPDQLEPTAVAGWLNAVELPSASTPFAAAYYPWLVVPDGLTNDATNRRIPPSGHVTGVYAQIDNSIGVQQPPANVELEFVVDVGKQVTAAQQGPLNQDGINVIRSFPGRGIRMWGARSLAAGDPNQQPWTFIHIRRTMSMIEDSVQKSMQWTVFESNDQNLRLTLTHSLNVFLERLWLTGGLQGASASEAFYVTCDDSNNPQSVIDMGRLVCEIGVAIAAPMEFLTFQITRLPDGTSTVEG